VLGLREQVRVGVEREARPRMAEDAADLRRVEFDVDHQVAGERVSQIVVVPTSARYERGLSG
jgi:hypothetical protein